MIIDPLEASSNGKGGELKERMVDHFLWWGSRTALLLTFVAVAVFLKEPLDKFIRQSELTNLIEIKKTETISTLRFMSKYISSLRDVESRFAGASRAIERTPQAEETIADAQNMINIANSSYRNLRTRFYEREVNVEPEVASESEELFAIIEKGLQDAQWYLEAVKAKKKVDIHFDAAILLFHRKAEKIRELDERYRQRIDQREVR